MLCEAGGAFLNSAFPPYLSLCDGSVSPSGRLTFPELTHCQLRRSCRAVGLSRTARKREAGNCEHARACSDRDKGLVVLDAANQRGYGCSQFARIDRLRHVNLVSGEEGAAPILGTCQCGQRDRWQSLV